jgi:hypothetical protein
MRFARGRRVGLEGGGDALMETDPLDGGDLAQQRLAHQCVVEPEPVAGFFDDEPRSQGLSDGLEQLALEHLLDDLEGELASDHRPDQQCFIGRLRQTRQAPADRLADALGERVGVPLPARLLHMAEHFDQKERIAGGDARQRLSEPGVVVAGGGQVGADIIRIQPAEGEPLGGAVAVQVGEHTGERVGAIEVGAAVGAQDVQPNAVTGAEQVAQQQQRGLGRPVHVVDHNQDRQLCGHRRQEASQRIEQQGPFSVWVGLGRSSQARNDIAELGRQTSQLLNAPDRTQAGRAEIRHQGAEGLGEGLVGGSHLLVAAPVQDNGTLVVGLAGRLRGQAGFTHPGLAGDEHGPGGAGGGGGPLSGQAIEFRPATDEGATGGQDWWQAGAVEGRWPARSVVRPHWG